MDDKIRELARREALVPDDPRSKQSLKLELLRRRQSNLVVEVDRLIADLRSSDIARRDRALIKARDKSGAIALELGARLCEGSCQKRRRAFEALRELNRLDLSHLLRASHDEDAPLRARAAQILAQICGPDRGAACERLIEMLDDRKRYVREAAIASCGQQLKIDEEFGLRTVLTKLLSDPSSKIRDCATAALLN